jgi:hypothetical protein
MMIPMRLHHMPLTKTREMVVTAVTALKSLIFVVVTEARFLRFGWGTWRE